MMQSRISIIFVLVTTCVVLTGCSSDKRAALCPGAAALVEASVLTEYLPGTTPDPAHALYRIAISNVTTDCDIDAGARTADTSLVIHVVATRPPSALAARYRVPYFVAVRQGPDIQSKKIYWLTFGFAPGETSVAFDREPDSTVVKIADDKQPYDYQLVTGFQLTREQLNYNRKMGNYGS
ncbi:MAG: hypothetical protein KGR48_09760 [Alphaproteobacteria bacterium]|nr:hypothetical protein [Alphaproteobacteria bacterium]MDE2073195.1 hypothetical protein [Alphaproteobacteria bacterium]